MILTRAPLRISLAGGGSDLPAFFVQDSGSVISFSINKFVYLAIHDYFSGGIRIKYSNQEEVSAPDEITHPIFRETLLALRFQKSVEIASFADVPGDGTGLGSSSALTNALIAGLNAFNRIPVDKAKNAELACRIEIVSCKQNIGLQDQWSSALGGINVLTFEKDWSVHPEKVQLSQHSIDFINNDLRLFYLGKGRQATDILKEQSCNILSNVEFRNRQKSLVNMVPEMKTAIESGDADQVGFILNESWQIKRKMSSLITSNAIDSIYFDAIKSGASGGKVLGAGGGGFLLLCVPRKQKEKFDEMFVSLRELPFQIEFDGVGIEYDDRTK